MAKKMANLVNQVLRGEASEPRLAEVSSHFFAIAGGPRRVAQLLYEEFVASKAGSLIRQRILDMILRMTRFANERSSNLDDLSQLTEDDLQTVLVDVLKDIAAGDEPTDAA